MLIDSYSENNTNYDLYVCNGFYTYFGQQFMSNIRCEIDSCKFYIKKYGAPTGSVYAKLYALNGNPTTLLATSEALDISTLTTTYELKTFNFSNRATIDQGTYVIILNYEGGSMGIAAVKLALTLEGNHTGKSFGYFLGWDESSTNDVPFYIYGTPKTDLSSCSYNMREEGTKEKYRMLKKRNSIIRNS